MDRRIGVRFTKGSMSPRAVGKLELDVDPLAERMMIMNRVTAAVYYMGKTDIKVRYVPQSLAVDANLMVIILDDDREYTAAIADGVKAEMIDIKDIV
ncbi:hypothetical protein [Shewanella fidelis]|uniref:Uncharacterized protein n=1 Tax=Shewanella fidelis TaxID=173509 RepID=A0AAW8NJU2_9GAMM|nr:hypothetical protein [Shewanella fidelis]MDR8523483.1 hypothetical protein [Shewanella fidelis]MDW4813284.1 hypothetical protein [Shewanella fidelis]MDW4817344.1 hypothetical protein [Shewanella fidelis]MDW4821300.1 hypothetical protein [Shewanella fidelis]MDW4824622.1 hypothetical protein [Shewanella fidelis]